MLVNYIFERTREQPSYASSVNAAATAVELATAASPLSRLSVAPGQNELFVDVVEKISATFVTSSATQGQHSRGRLAAAKLLHAELDGTIWMKSYLQGRPEVRCVFDKMLLVGEQPEADTEAEAEGENGAAAAAAAAAAPMGVIVDDTVFHDCVQVGSSGSEPGAELASLRVLRVRPPPAEDIAAMRYRVSMDAGGDVAPPSPSSSASSMMGPGYGTGNIRLPFVVSTSTRSAAAVPAPGDMAVTAAGAGAGGRTIEAEVHLDAVFPDEHDAEDVCVRVLLPRAAVSCLCRVDNAQRRGSLSGVDVEGERAYVGDAVPASVGPSSRPERGATGGAGESALQAVYWRMASVRGGSHCVMRLTIQVQAHRSIGSGGEEPAAAAHESAGLGPISLLFDLPMLQCSRVVLKHVRVYDSGKANEAAHRWLRYMSQSASFECRPG